jgi:hypothetical protein
VDSAGVVRRRWTLADLPVENGVRGTGLCPPDQPADRPVQILVWGTDIATNPSTLFFVRTDTGEVKPVPTLGTTFGAQVTFVEQSAAPPLVAVSPGPLSGYYGAFQLQTLGHSVLRHITFDENPSRFGNSLAAVDVDEDANEELILGEGTGPGRGFEVQVRSREGNLLYTWQAYSRADW